MFKNALISVSDKTGLVEFIRPYVQAGMRVVSTGGTLNVLREAGIGVIDVSQQTGFQEVMDGRVKTLHPRVHMALLARKGHPDDEQLLAAEDLEPFDLVVVNLYPFAAALGRGVAGNELIEFIDIGGPSLLRAAAKNHQRVAVVCEPSDYSWIASKTELSLNDRRRLAGRVFEQTSRYDDLIAKTLLSEDERPQTLVGSLVSELRYGENPQQKGFWYRRLDVSAGLEQATILHGKVLSYNNLLDLDSAARTVRQMKGAAAVAVKHNSPCGVGTDSVVAGAVKKALEADPVSIFGGIVAVNCEVDLPAAQAMSQIFLECIIAPEFTPDALELLKKKKDLRLLKWQGVGDPRNETQFRTIAGGFLVQTDDTTLDGTNSWRLLGHHAESLGQTVDQIPSEIRADLLLAWSTCAQLKSNAIAIVSDRQTVGLGMGQVNRVDAVEQAIARMHRHHRDTRKDLVLASDAFFPFPDSVELAAQAGVRWIIQPGGSIRDPDVVKMAEKLGVNMILTGTRHFRH